MTPPVTATPEKATSMVPLEWAFEPGTTWQVAQAMGADSGEPVEPWFTWARWAPGMPLTEATAGGATATFTSAPVTPVRPVVPWQEVQDSFERSRLPSTCCAATMIDCVALS